MRRFRPLRRRNREEPDQFAAEAPESDAAEEYADDDYEESAASYADDAVPYAEREYEPFVPVDSGRGYAEGYDGQDEAIEEPGRRRLSLPRPRLRAPRVRIPRPGLPRIDLGVEINWTVLLVVALLVAGGIFGTLLYQGRLRDDVEAWWPIVVIAGAVLWMLVALARRQVTAFLGAAALSGVGLSALLSTQDVAAFRDTLFGIMLITLGLGIVVRGFLLRGSAA